MLSRRYGNIFASVVGRRHNDGSLNRELYLLPFQATLSRTPLLCLRPTAEEIRLQDTGENFKIFSEIVAVTFASVVGQRHNDGVLNRK